jgi:flagellar biosynthesis protein FlhG
MISTEKTSGLKNGDLFQNLDPPKKEVWVMGGGKGGTGKSFISASLGVALSKRGKRVLLVDADLGCANLHTFLGVDPVATLSDFITGKVKDIEKVLTPTDIPNLVILSGARDVLDIANPKHLQKVGLLERIRALPFEHIILDLGAGTSPMNLDFFLSADTGMLPVLPEPTSIENAYRFIKSAFYRHFKRWAQQPQVKRMIEEVMARKGEYGIETPYDLVERVATMDNGVGQKMKEAVLSFSPKVIVNQVRSRDDITLGFSIRSSCTKYFGIKVEYMGYIEYDDHVWMAIKKKTPLIIDSPYCSSARCLDRVLTNLLKKDEMKLESLLRI